MPARQQTNKKIFNFPYFAWTADFEPQSIIIARNKATTHTKTEANNF